MQTLDPHSSRPDGALVSPAVARNTGPILEVLKAHLPAGGHVLEIASGGGEHAAAFAQALPGLEWTPSDPSEQARASIEAWRVQAGLANLRPALDLDASDPDWPRVAGGQPFKAVVCINMVHISPWRATQGLMAGTGRLLDLGGLLYLYGPYREAEAPLAPSNAAFDADLKARDPEWGLRDAADVAALARSHGLHLTRRVAMPANNLSLLFRKA